MNIKKIDILVINQYNNNRINIKKIDIIPVVIYKKRKEG